MKSQLKNEARMMIVGAIISAFCSVEEFRGLCRGLDLQLGHIPTYYSWVFASPTLPIFGAVGLEAVLNVANQVCRGGGSLGQ